MGQKYLKGISANIILLGVVSFLNDLSSEMIMPILPMFITALGGTGIIVGLVGGMKESLASILRVFFGYFSDRTGKRKIFIYAGYLFSSFFKLFLALAKSCPQILTFSAFERVGKGMRTAPRDALIADAQPEEKGKGFGIHRTLDTLGAICGAGLVFLLFWFLQLDFKTIILVAAIIAFFSLIPLSFVKEKQRQPQRISLKIGLTVLPKPLKLFIMISAVFSLANFSYMFFILRAKQFFAGKLSVGAPILLYILFNIFYAAFAFPFGVLSDKIGRKKVIIWGYLLFTLTTFGFAFFNFPLALIILFAFYGIVQALIDGNQRAYVADLSSLELKGTALGTFHTTIGLAALPASLIAGFLWQNVSPGATFFYGSCTSVIAVILFIVFRKYLP